MADYLSRYPSSYSTVENAQSVLPAPAAVDSDILISQVEELPVDTGEVPADVGATPTSVINTLSTVALPSKEFIDKLVAGYMMDDFFSKIVTNSSEYPDFTRSSQGVLYKDQTKLCVPSSLIQELLNYHHLSLYGGHIGINRLQRWLQDKYYFPGLAKIVDHFVSQCHTCARVKPRTYTPGSLQNVDAPGARWSTIAVDVVNGFPTIHFEGQDVNGLLVIMDTFSHHTHLYPVGSNFDAKAFLKILIHKLFPLHGLPQTIRSDLGSTCCLR